LVEPLVKPRENPARMARETVMGRRVKNRRVRRSGLAVEWEAAVRETLEVERVDM
jgi:hypothetical protein